MIENSAPKVGQVLTSEGWKFPEEFNPYSFLGAGQIISYEEPKNDDFGITSKILNTIITYINDYIDIKFFSSEKYPKINNIENILVKVNETTLVCGNITLIFIKPTECYNFFHSYKNIYEMIIPERIEDSSPLGEKDYPNKKIKLN